MTNGCLEKTVCGGRVSTILTSLKENTPVEIITTGKGRGGGGSKDHIGMFTFNPSGCVCMCVCMY